MRRAALLWLLLGLPPGSHAARRPPAPPNVTCEWHFANGVNRLVIFFDDVQDESPLHATTAVCSTSTLLPADVQRGAEGSNPECQGLKSTNRVQHVATFLIAPADRLGPGTVRPRRAARPDARAAAVVVTFCPQLCEPLHALLEPGAMLRVSNGRLFWSWAGRDPAHFIASPRVAKASSPLGDFEMRFPVLCSYVRPRQTYMKGQPGMHKFVFKSEVAPGAEYFSGGESEHKMKVWISHETANVRYVFLYTWMNKALYYRANPAWSLCHFRTFFAATGGAMAEVGNVPPTDPKYLRSDYRKDQQALARWTNERLARLAEQSGHPELAHAPVIFWGWSRDGMQAASYAEAAPGRTLGAVRYMAAQHESERGFDFGGEISRIPFLLTMADSDYMAGMDNVNFLRKGRAHGAPWVCALMRHSTHGMNQDKYGLLFPWILSLLDQLPADTSRYTSPPGLRRPNTTAGWLGNLDKVTAVLTDKGAWRSSVNDNDFAVGPVGAFLYPPTSAAWFRTAALARLWREWNTADAPTARVLAAFVTRRETKEGSPVPAVFTIVRPPYPSPVTVTYSLQGTAAEGQDFEPVERQATIPADASAADVLVLALEDSVPEEAETVELVLEAPPGYELMETVPLIIIIHDSAAAHPAPAAGPTPSWEALGLRRQAPVGTTSMPTVPPADVCPADCGTHGRCVGGQCDCDAGWQGPQCQECVAPECSATGDGLEAASEPAPAAPPPNVPKAPEWPAPDRPQAEGERPRPKKPKRRDGGNEDGRDGGHGAEVGLSAAQPAEEGKFVDAKSGVVITMGLGQCDFKGGVVRNAGRGKSLEECRADLLAVHQRDGAVDGAEVSLDSRRLCWVITGVRGIKHPLSPNPKFRCLKVSAGSALNPATLPETAPLEKGTTGDAKEGASVEPRADMVVQNVVPAVAEAAPTVAMPAQASPAAVGLQPLAHSSGATATVPEVPPVPVDPFSRLTMADLLAEDRPATNPLITVVGYSVGGLLVLLTFRGYYRSRRAGRRPPMQ